MGYSSLMDIETIPNLIEFFYRNKTCMHVDAKWRSMAIYKYNYMQVGFDIKLYNYVVNIQTHDQSYRSSIK